MDIAAFLKKLFPKPNIPQKRYLIVIGLAVYWALKVYTIYTPDPTDDDWPDFFRRSVVEMYTQLGDDVSIGDGLQKGISGDAAYSQYAESPNDDSP